LAASTVAKKSVVSRPRPVSFCAFGRRAVRSFRQDPDLRGDHDVLDIAGVLTVDREQRCQRRLVVPVGDRQRIERPTIDLELRNRADAEAEANCRDPPQIAFETGRGVLLVFREVDPGLDEQPAGANRFRVLSGQRPLLGGQWTCRQHD
jgi:hypothetical protein